MKQENVSIHIAKLQEGQNPGVLRDGWVMAGRWEGCYSDELHLEKMLLSYLVQFRRSQGRTLIGLAEFSALSSSHCGSRGKSMQKLSHHPDPMLEQGDWGGASTLQKRRMCTPRSRERYRALKAPVSSLSTEQQQQHNDDRIWEATDSLLFPW